MMLIIESLKLALTSIKMNKLRSFLTMLGMIIGISSVISIVSIGDTMRGVISKEYESFGKNRISIYIYNSDEGYSDVFSFEEIEKIQEAFPDDINYIGPSTGISGEIINKNQKNKCNINGLSPNYQNIQNFKIIYGRNLSENDINAGKKYVLLQNTSSSKLFGTEDGTGKIITVESNGTIEEYLVVGIYENTQSTFQKLFAGNSDTHTLYAPARAFSSEDSAFFNIDLNINDTTDKELFKSRVASLIGRMKNVEPQHVRVYAASDEMSTIDDMMSKLSLAVGAIAAISLIVGGIGIMNIMLVSVTERTREIGIRKALGARTSDILLQFLIESAIISAAGGIIGTILGAGTILLGGLLINIPVVIKPTVILTAVSFSALVGIFFGLYPAKKAASKDPIAALRYE